MPPPPADSSIGSRGPAALGVDAAVRSEQAVPMDSRLLRELAPSVIRIVRQMLGARHPEVEDLTQESLRALLTAWPNFRGECSPAHFARRIAAQRCIDTLRSHRVRSATLHELSSWPPETSESMSQSARVRQAWSAALAELPPEQASALTQRYVLGYTLEEIAQEARVPLNTVKSRLRLAKRVLRARVVREPRLADVMRAP